MSPTKEDIEIMDKQDDVTLAQWYNKLNRWGWPEELPNEDMAHKNLGKWKPNSRRSNLMDWIYEKVGPRLISWEHNKKSMTKEEFNDFFAGCYEGDKEAKSRYEKQLMKRIEQQHA